MSNDDFRDAGTFLGISVMFWIAAVVLALATVVTFTLIEPWFAEQHTTTTRQSTSYITSKQQSLRTLFESYLALGARLETEQDLTTVDALSRQQKALLQHMRADADLIPPQYVPADVRDFLNEHRR